MVSSVASWILDVKFGRIDAPALNSKFDVALLDLGNDVLCRDIFDGRISLAISLHSIRRIEA